MIFFLLAQASKYQVSRYSYHFSQSVVLVYRCAYAPYCALYRYRLPNKWLVLLPKTACCLCAQGRHVCLGATSSLALRGAPLGPLRTLARRKALARSVCWVWSSASRVARSASDVLAVAATVAAAAAIVAFSASFMPLAQLSIEVVAIILVVFTGWLPLRSRARSSSRRSTSTFSTCQRAVSLTRSPLAAARSQYSGCNPSHASKLKGCNPVRQVHLSGSVKALPLVFAQLTRSIAPTKPNLF
jgi:hypothetical protein